MSLREQFADLQKESEELKGLIQQLYRREHELFSKKQDIHIQLIREEKLLAVKPWIYCGRSSSGTNSTFTLSSKRRNFPQLTDLLQPDYHEQYFLATEKRIRKVGGREITQDHQTVKLHFADEDVCLAFDNDEIAMAFIKEHGITIDYSGLQKQRDTMAVQLKSLDEIIQNLEQNQ